MSKLHGVSRRQVLSVAAGVAGASVTGATAVIGTSMPAHAAKMSQEAAKYQSTPKGEQRCDSCLLFEPPAACKSVDGTIAPEGWCRIYAKKKT